ncbi:unnamed protein product [Calicophoron daubneyi]|uniref:Uncharacterized protein n=1 Tax=Calicophoron daubneyi TaxID=300641 RepID=A0AAV2T575_CALDB
MYLLPSAVAQSRTPGEGPDIFRSYERVLPTQIDALKDLDYLTREVNAVRYETPMRSYPPPGAYSSENFGKLREAYYPVTLGDNVKFHLNLFKPLSHRLTISPPAFGLTQRPGDDFAPWQRTLAEEAPKLAITTYRHAVDDADFDQTIDETGQVRNSTGTRSTRRTRPRSAPPRAMGYLKSTVRTLEEMNKTVPNDHSIYAPYDSAAYSSTLQKTKIHVPMMIGSRHFSL